MTHYLYPQNLKASANMWFWSLKDFAILGIATLLSIVMLVELRFLLPAAATLCFAFLSIRMDETTILGLPAVRSPLFSYHTAVF